MVIQVRARPFGNHRRATHSRTAACYLQSFWHLTSMRHFLLHVEIKDESRTVEANVLRALRVTNAVGSNTGTSA